MASTTNSDENKTDEAAVENSRFFTWIRALGLQRGQGWISGVCAGVADRLAIDPLIVRGIVIVVAVLGGPALLLYAVMWLLLPDQSDEIVLERLLRGRVEPAIAGIGALVLLSFLPLAQGFWYSGATFWADPGWMGAVGRMLWTAVLLAAIVVFVVWIARRSSVDSSAPTVSPATTDAQPDTIPGPPPTAPGSGAPEEEVAAWRERQAAWRAEREEFRAQQADIQREMRQQRAAESRERALAAGAEAAERHRLRRLANPRLSAAATVLAIGAAIVAGGVTSVVVAGTPRLADSALPIGLAVTSVVLALSIVLAGALRRSSGFLGFVTTVALLLASGTALIPTDRQLLFPSAYVIGTGSYAQPFGSADIVVSESTSSGVTDLWAGLGNVRIRLQEGAAANVEIVARNSTVTTWTLEALGNGVSGLTPEVPGGQADARGEERWNLTFGDPAAATTRTIRIWQGAGTIEITDESMPLTGDDQ